MHKVERCFLALLLACSAYSIGDCVCRQTFCTLKACIAGFSL